MFQSSAIGRRGGYISGKELFLATQAEIGFTDRFSMQLGASLPVLLFGLPHLGFGGKYSIEIRPMTHFAVGVQGFSFDGNLPSVASTMLTFDRNWGNVSFGLLVPFQAFHQRIEGWEPPSSLATASGFLALGRRVGIVTENWVHAAKGGHESLRPWVLNALALRFMGDAASFDLGFLRVNQNQPLIPWFELGVGW